jgi:anti-sigma factor RsiW
MTRETQLKLQAWLDGELPEADVREVRRLVERDPQAAALVRELRLTRQWLAAGEVLHPVPETREFYWSQIARRLAPREVPLAEPVLSGRPWRHWLAWLAPATALAVWLAVWLLPRLAPAQSAAARPTEIETPAEELGTFTYRSDTEQMTVVWVNSH